MKYFFLAVFFIICVFSITYDNTAQACCPKGMITIPKPPPPPPPPEVAPPISTPGPKGPPLPLPTGNPKPIPEPTPSPAPDTPTNEPAATSTAVRIQWQTWWETNKDKYLDYHKAFPKDALETNPDGTTAQSKQLVDLKRFFENELTNSTYSIRLAIAIAIGRTGDGSYAAALKKNTADSEREVRDYTTLGLGMIKDTGSIQQLSDILLNSKGHTISRGISAYALGFTRDPKALEILKKVLDSREERDDTLYACTIALGLFKDPALNDYLKNILVPKKSKDDLPYKRAYAALALGRIGGDEAADILINAIAKEKNIEVLRAISIALGMTGNPKAKKALAAMIDKSNDELVKGFAVIALAQLKTDDGYEIILPYAMDKRYEDFRGFAVLSLGILGDKKAGSELKKIMADKRASESVKTAAILAMGLLGAKEYSTDILEIAKSQTELESKRCFAAISIGLMGDKANVPALKEIFENSAFAFDLYRDSALALALLGENKMVLEKMYKDYDEKPAYVKAIALGVFGSIGDKETVSFVLARYEKEDNKSMKLLMITALGYLADPNRMSVLKELTADNNYQIKFLSIDHITAIP
ncbi:MAG: HEAT repeat domain-containing protein [Planctomycetes bacterium]|nr:HEAT repeat domain-containing protein [Planctomycetota bacterium]